MSGRFTAHQLNVLLNKDGKSESENNILKSLGILNEELKVMQVPAEQLIALCGTLPNDLVFLTADGSLISETARNALNIQISSTVLDPVPSGSGEGSNAPRVHSTPTETRMAIEDLPTWLNSQSINIREDLIKETLERYVDSIPKEAEPYLSGEVSIYKFSGVEVNIKSLVAAGTMILDAVLYIAYSGVPANQGIFFERILNVSHFDTRLAIENISKSSKALKAALTMVYNQGSLPVEGNNERGLSQFIKVTLFHNENLTCTDIARLLSTASTMKFPARVLLGINIDRLPVDVASRCKMSIAGNRAIRYAVLAKGFERAAIPALDYTNTFTLSKSTAEARKVESAISICDALAGISGNWRVQLIMHPFSSEKPTIKNFTLKLTHAVLYSLSQTGRTLMRGKIISEKIKAFEKDENFFGREGISSSIVYDIFENPNANFSGMNGESVKSAYKMNE